MSTAKKVASVSTERKNKSATAAVKKAPKTSVKTFIVKKSASASKEGASKVSILNHAKLPKRLKDSKKIGTKLTTLESLRAKHVAAVELKAKKILKGKMPRTSPVLSLALLSNYRFPVKAEQIAISTARFGGVFFVLAGAVLSLFFANGSFGAHSELASVSTGYSGATTTTNTQVNCSDPLQYLSPSCAGVVNKTPTATFDVNGSNPLKGTVRVRIKVEHATKVSLNAYFKTQTQELRLGTLGKVGDDTWEINIDTTARDDGQYKFKALVENGYGAYETLDSAYWSIENHPAPITTTQTTTNTTTGTTASSTRTATTTSTQATSNTLTNTTDAALTTSKSMGQPRLTLSSGGSDTEFRFEIAVAGATTVKLFTRLGESTQNILVGYAYKSSDSIWRYRWLTGALPDGKYFVTAVANDTVSEVQSNAISVIKNTETATQQTSTSTIAAAALQTAPETLALKPEMTVKVQPSSPNEGIVYVTIDVPSATLVEVYALDRSSLTKKFLGNAIVVDQDTWLYRFDTKQTPNGEYKLIAQVRNQYGSYEGESSYIKISNVLATAVTPKQEEEKKVLQDIAAETAKARAVAEPATVAVQKEVVTPDANVASSSPTEERAEAQREIAVAPESSVDKALASYKTRIDKELQKLASALRVNDQKAIVSAKERLEEIKQEVISSKLADADKQIFVTEIDSYMKAAIARVEEDVKATEKIIAERTQKEASQDSDKDGIADYDEVNIYKTDPFSADSDGDGFTDGAEILGGYDPHSTASEILVTYESPKDMGIVREDILKVNSITTAAKDEDQGQDTVKPVAAILTGKALPNSFVTLYIFSTPIVVTVKTDQDGSWNYRFDKELEDGQHQVYVGVTDNAGKIIAKSNPFTFVKTAQAFSPSDDTAAAAPVVVEQKSFLSEYMVYLVLSISVVAIGLVLILLGLHLDNEKRRFGVVRSESGATV